VFAANDPYFGGDIDHAQNGGDNAEMLALLPDTYAEVSPSCNGIKFIARASDEYGRLSGARTARQVCLYVE
jgi:hypothetical protein